jgi:cob(I)alamin adenosyltransferase
VAESGRYGLVVFDEINYAMDYGILATEEVVRFLKRKPQDLHIVLTGRNVPPEVVEVADMVTEMKEIKHHFARGIKARKGIEY